jgi:uncharacterized membrane protein YqiK
MREQRHIRRANKARAEAGEGRGLLQHGLERTSALAPRPPPPTLEDDDSRMHRSVRSTLNEKPPVVSCDPRLRGEIESILQEGTEEDETINPQYAALNEYMREQRHQRQENRKRAESQEAGLDIEAYIKQAEVIEAARIADAQKKRKHAGGVVVRVSEDGGFVSASNSIDAGQRGRMMF